MPQPAEPARRDAGVSPPAGTGPRTGESAPRPQYEGLLREPDWPPDDESE